MRDFLVGCEKCSTINLRLTGSKLANVAVKMRTGRQRNDTRCRMHEALTAICLAAPLGQTHAARTLLEIWQRMAWFRCWQKEFPVQEPDHLYGGIVARLYRASSFYLPVHLFSFLPVCSKGKCFNGSKNSLAEGNHETDVVYKAVCKCMV